ncbi:MAG TPA: formylglycine-generating enzyme family protein [Steroidobacteraceae bacterium]|nr:formylglycine-generating enzyme family protein [Steroidobacteraceae bacterium]
MRRGPVLALLVLAAVGGALVAWLAHRATQIGLPGLPTEATAAPARDCGAPAGDATHPGMAFVPGGDFRFGSDAAFPEEGPSAAAHVAGFWMDQTEVTNAQFAEFVAATGYRTLAERGVKRSNRADAPVEAGSAVFKPRGEGEAMRSFVNWWQFVAGADWRHPEGPGSSIAGREQHPVVHVAYEDALAYAKWKGRTLPTEVQFEYAAQGSGRKNAAGQWASNTWQGTFPSLNTAADGYAGTAPVACFEPNARGIFDLVGNVWEWTSSVYFERHDASDVGKHPGGFDPTQPDERDVAVVKGGSYLCSPDYCMRYRPEARIGQSRGLGAAHIGFRTVLNP